MIRNQSFVRLSRLVLIGVCCAFASHCLSQTRAAPKAPYSVNIAGNDLQVKRANNLVWKVELPTASDPKFLFWDSSTLILSTGALAVAVIKSSEEAKQAAEWLTKYRIVYCHNVSNGSITWRRSEMQVGCPIFADGKRLVTIKCSNLEAALLNRTKATFRLCHLDISSGKILGSRPFLLSNRKAAELLSGLLSTESLRKCTVTWSKNLIQVKKCYGVDFEVVR